MEFSYFIVILTDECNFNCSYCYQKRGNTYLDSTVLKKSFNFFLPFLKEECFIGFTGGEPLLAFNLIEQAVNHLKNNTLGKEIKFSLTTNGSLINEDILNFLSQHKFSIVLSFDGLAQDEFRRKGSFEQLIRTIKKILNEEDIVLEINSVFTPDTVRYFSDSMKSLIDLNVSNISFALSKIPEWDLPSLILLEKELESLRTFSLRYYKKTGTIPLPSMWRRYRREIFSCAAGKHRMALAPDGMLWGCYLFPEHFKGKEGTREYQRYAFGDVDAFIENHERIYTEVMTNYLNLRMDKFYTDDQTCIQCVDLKECWTCPLDAAFSTSIIGKIPGWTCKIKKIFRKEKELFWKELDALK